MNKLVALIVGLTTLGLVGCSGEQWLDHQGNAIQRDDLAGRWVIVNYWAEWCAPCREELPELNALAAKRPDVLVLGIHFDNVVGDELAQLSEQMGIRFPVLGHDFAAAYQLALPQVLPTTYILDPQGSIAHQLQGPQDEESLLAMLGGGEG